MIVRRVEALGKLLETEDGKNLLAGYRRAANILRAEEKKDGAEAFAGKHVQTPLAPPAERYLADVVASAGAAARQHAASEDFEGAMRALAALRAPVDGFFLDVTVNDPDPQTRAEPLEIAQRIARGDARRRRLLQGRGISRSFKNPPAAHKWRRGAFGARIRKIEPWR